MEVIRQTITLSHSHQCIITGHNINNHRKRLLTIRLWKTMRTEINNSRWPMVYECHHGRIHSSSMSSVTTKIVAVVAWTILDRRRRIHTNPSCRIPKILEHPKERILSIGTNRPCLRSGPISYRRDPVILQEKLCGRKVDVHHQKIWINSNNNSFTGPHPVMATVTTLSLRSDRNRRNGMSKYQINPNRSLIKPRLCGRNYISA